MSAVRRRILTNPHESLLLCHSVIDLSARFAEFADLSGVPDDAIVSNALSAVPIPDYRKIEPGRRRWVGTRPEFMWHPLMWLPERLATRMALTLPDGTKIREIEPVYTLRVIAELSASNLYDSESGTWADVLSIVGLDITDPSVQDRVAAWLDGGADDVLDAIDLTDVLLNDDPDWAFNLAVDLVLPSRYASWAVMANDMTEVLNMAADGDAEDIQNAVSAIYYSGEAEMRSVPHAGQPNSDAFWTELGRAVEDAPADQLVALHVPRLLEYLEGVRDEYWSHYESLPSILLEDPEQSGAPAPEPEPDTKPASPFETAIEDDKTPPVRPPSPFDTDDDLTPPTVSEPVRPALPWQD